MFGHFPKQFLLCDHETYVTSMSEVLSGVHEPWPPEAISLGFFYPEKAKIVQIHVFWSFSEKGLYSVTMKLGLRVYQRYIKESHEKNLFQALWAGQIYPAHILETAGLLSMFWKPYNMKTCWPQMHTILVISTRGTRGVIWPVGPNLVWDLIYIYIYIYMGRVTELQLSRYLVLLSIDSKTR